MSNYFEDYAIQPNIEYLMSLPRSAPTQNFDSLPPPIPTPAPQPSLMPAAETSHSSMQLMAPWDRAAHYTTSSLPTYATHAPSSPVFSPSLSNRRVTPLNHSAPMPMHGFFPSGMNSGYPLSSSSPSVGYVPLTVKLENTHSHMYAPPMPMSGSSFPGNYHPGAYALPDTSTTSQSIEFVQEKFEKEQGGPRISRGHTSDHSISSQPPRTASKLSAHTPAFVPAEETLPGTSQGLIAKKVFKLWSKLQLCRSFHKSPEDPKPAPCRFGDACRYAHSLEELGQEIMIPTGAVTFVAPY